MNIYFKLLALSPAGSKRLGAKTAISDFRSRIWMLEIFSERLHAFLTNWQWVNSIPKSRVLVTYPLVRL